MGAGGAMRAINRRLPLGLAVVPVALLGCHRAAVALTAIVPAGPFAMGTSDEERRQLVDLCEAKDWRCAADSFASELPRREVEVPRFEIDRLEVSNQRYEDCVQRGDCQKRDMARCTLARSDPAPPPPELLENQMPAVCVTWEQATRYCRANGGRLPSEAEWEKAARGVDGRGFPWGNDWDPARANWGDDGKADGYVLSAPVGSFRTGASPYGALDMAGNVWEWVASLDQPELRPDPGMKPTRGGGFAAYPLAMRAAKRALQPENAAYGNVGFRCAK